MNNLLTSVLINRQVPEFVREDYPAFINFIEAYYEFLEQDNNIIDRSKQLLDITDVDKSIDEFESYFFNTYAPLIPLDSVANNEFIIKHILRLYQSKGSQKSFELFFRLVFGEEIEISYPKRQVLRASSGRWRVDTSLKVSPEISSIYIGDGNTREYTIIPSNYDYIRVYINDIEIITGYIILPEYNRILFDTNINNGDILKVIHNDINIELLHNRKFIGNSSGASIISETVLSRLLNNTNILEIYVDNKTLLGEFDYGEELSSSIFVNDILLDIRLTTISQLQSLEIIDGGFSYSSGDQVIFHVSNAERMPTAIVNEVYTGSVDLVTIDNGGCGYEIGGQLSIGDISLPNVDVVINSVYTTSRNSANTFTIYSNIIADMNTNILISNSSYGLIGGTYTGNSNTRIVDTLSSNTYTNIGEIIGLDIIKTDVSFNYVPIIDVEPAKLVLANGTINIRDHGSLGKTLIVNAGIGYNRFDEVNIINKPKSWGIGAEAEIINVDNDGRILEVRFVPSRILGSANGSNTTVVVTGNDTYFIDELRVGNNIRINGEDKTVEVITSNTSLNVNSVFSNTFNNKPIRLYGKYLLGGQGYEQDNLPDTEIVSITGSNGIIEIVAIMGDGEDISANFTDAKFGGIKSITITDSGKTLKGIPAVDLTQSGDGSAIVLAKLYEPYTVYPGRWITNDGLLSSYTTRLEGLDYYHDFSYFIKSKVEFNKYKRIIKKLLHPISLIGFAGYNITNEIDVSNIDIESNISINII